MSMIQFVKVRRVMAATVIGAAAWGATARAQALDQVPANAMVVIKVNNLQSVSQKIAKLAKDFGVDELQPQLKDPLGELMTQHHITKGIDKSGDLVVCGFDVEGDKGQGMAFIPIDDFKAFVSNFESAGPDSGDIREVKAPHEGPNLFIGDRGKYAAVSNTKELVQNKTGGLKLPASAAKDAQGRDAMFFVNIPVLRDKALPELKKNRQTAIDEMVKNLGNEENAKPFIGVAKVVAGEAFDFAENFLNDCQGAAFSVNLTDQGISLGALSEFAPGSKIGKTVAQFKNSNKPLLAGLPDRKYFAFGGMSWDAKAMGSVVSDALDPITKELATAGDNGKQIARLLEATKTLVVSVNKISAGYPAPQAVGAGNGEGLIQQVSVTQGDAKAIHDAEISLLNGVSQLMSLMPQNGGQIKFDVKPNDKTIDGVKFDTFTMNMNMDAKNPQAAQAQQMLGMIYGPNGMGGIMGQVDDKTFVMIQGGSDKLTSDTIASARSQKDALSGTKGVQLVSGQLLKQRSFEEYVALDNIVTTALKFAQNLGFSVKVKLPADLPPIGFAAGTENASFRGEMFIPSQTIQSLISAGLQAYQQVQGGGNGKL